jgi:hypothetical protein
MPLGWILAPFFELQKYLQSSLHREMKLHARKERKQGGRKPSLHRTECMSPRPGWLPLGRSYEREIQRSQAMIVA